MTPRVLDFGIGAIATAAFALLLAENTSLGEAHPGLFAYANMTVLLIFAADVLLRLGLSSDKKVYLRHKWFDFIVFIPLIQFLPHVRAAESFVIARQVVIVTILISRSRRTGKLMTMLSLRPAQLMVGGFVLAIGIGAVLLTLPMATAGSGRTTLVDAVFTTTSAVCVTGLIVQDTATHFSRFGQLVILALIQAGGLGIMTFSVSLAVVLRKQLNVRHRAAMQDILDHDTLAGVRRLIVFILTMTLALELSGAIALSVAWWGRFDSPLSAIYHACFHSVSAFCNAGFSTFSDNLVGFRRHFPTNLIICVLIVMGGIGFMVIRDLLELITERHDIRTRRLRIQTKIALWMTALLIMAGAVLIYMVEQHSHFGAFTRGEAWLASLFQSVTARTAGFNTCDISRLSGATLLITIVLMFIGGSPGSTAGGIKTTTLAVLCATVYNSLGQRQGVEIHRRTIPPEVVFKAVSLFLISLGIVAGFAAVLLYLEQKPFADIVFETVSAFGTVGLSTGITPTLTPQGKLVVAVLMFVGRLGPLTIAYALMRRRPPAKYEYAEERVMIG